MPNFLFWNTRGTTDDKLVADLANHEDADLLILAELQIDPYKLLQTLNQENSEFRYAAGFCPTLHFFTRFDDTFLVRRSEGQRFSIRSLELPARENIIIAAAHLPSQLQYSTWDIAMECQSLASNISAEEEQLGHERTILMGDLNLNPFDDGVVAASGLHASMSRRVASGLRRTIQGKQYKFFYNPMWSHMSDQQDDTAGTYYYSKATHKNFFWNTFDQVLIRPNLLSSFKSDDVSVVKSTGHQSLVDNRGKPRGSISDHLPVKLNIEF